jgi:hypothetical protein
MGRRSKYWLLAGLLALAPGCSRETGRLSPAQEQRFAAEGLLHRADNVTFRWTQGAGARGGTWEDRVASIVVTRRSVLVHKNEKVGIEIGPDSRAGYDVHRDGRRVRISAGTGGTAETWSFLPSDDAEAWTQDIRSVIRATGTAAP